MKRSLFPPFFICLTKILFHFFSHIYRDQEQSMTWIIVKPNFLAGVSISSHLSHLICKTLLNTITTHKHRVISKLVYESLLSVAESISIYFFQFHSFHMWIVPSLNNEARTLLLSWNDPHEKPASPFVNLGYDLLTRIRAVPARL